MILDKNQISPSLEIIEIMGLSQVTIKSGTFDDMNSNLSFLIFKDIDNIILEQEALYFPEKTR